MRHRPFIRVHCRRTGNSHFGDALDDGILGHVVIACASSQPASIAAMKRQRAEHMRQAVESHEIASK